MCGNNNCSLAIILVLLFLCCGNGNGILGGCGNNCGSDCGCNNNCGC